MATLVFLAKSLLILVLSSFVVTAVSAGPGEEEGRPVQEHHPGASSLNVVYEQVKGDRGIARLLEFRTLLGTLGESKRQPAG